MDSQKQQAFNEILQNQLTQKYINHQITDNGVMEITLDRPNRSNAFNGGMWNDFTNLIRQASDDPKVQVVLLKANGKNFCTGNDLGAIMDFDLEDDEIRQSWASVASQQAKDYCYAIIDCKKTLIACTNGGVFGFMFTSLLLFDLVISTQDTYFIAPMVKSSQNIEMCGSYTLPRLFGQQKAFELLVLGRTLKVQDALKAGFVNQIVQNKQQLNEEGHKIANEICQLNRQCVFQARSLMKNDLTVVDQLFSKKLVMMNAKF